MVEPTARARWPRVDDPVKERDDWIKLLDDLVKTVEEWVRPEQWATRVIPKAMQDSALGNYEAPALLMQREVARVLLEPITRFAPGTQGVVDLYLMPAYDDIARLHRDSGEWKIRCFSWRDEASARSRSTSHCP